MLAVPPNSPSGSSGVCRGERGEVLPLLILWPAMVVLLVVLAAQALVVSGARAQAEAAASAGLRAAWAAAADAGLVSAHDGSPHPGVDPHPGTLSMAQAAHDAVAHTAAASAAGWRWWTPGASVVRSDWCHSGADASRRPGAGQPGWVRVEVTGETVGPFSALWPGRLDRVHAAAAGPALLTAAAAAVGDPAADPDNITAPAVPLTLPQC